MNYSGCGQLYLGLNFSWARANTAPGEVPGTSEQELCHSRGSSAALGVAPETHFSGRLCQVVQISNKNVNFCKAGKKIFSNQYGTPQP